MAGEAQIQQKVAKIDHSETDMTLTSSVSPQTRPRSWWALGVAFIALTVSLAHISLPVWSGFLGPILQKVGLSLPIIEQKTDLVEMQAQLDQVHHNLTNYRQEKRALPDRPVMDAEIANFRADLKRFRAQLAADQLSDQTQLADMSRELDVMTDQLLHVSHEITQAKHDLATQQQKLLSQTEQEMQSLRTQKTVIAQLQLQQNRFDQQLDFFRQKVDRVDGQKWLAQVMRIALATKLTQGGTYASFWEFIENGQLLVSSEARQFLLRHRQYRLPTMVEIQLIYQVMRPTLVAGVMQLPDVVAAREQDQVADPQNWVSQTWDRAKSLVRIEKISPELSETSPEKSADSERSHPSLIGLDLVKRLDQAVYQSHLTNILSLGQQLQTQYEDLSDQMTGWLEKVAKYQKVTEISDQLLNTGLSNNVLMQPEDVSSSVFQRNGA